MTCICSLLSVAIVPIFKTSKTHIVVENQIRDELLDFEYPNVLTKANTSPSAKLDQPSAVVQINEFSEASHSQ